MPHRLKGQGLGRPVAGLRSSWWPGFPGRVGRLRTVRLVQTLAIPLRDIAAHTGNSGLLTAVIPEMCLLH